MREEAARHGTRRAALIGLAATGGVITSAGLVLAGTFAAVVLAVDRQVREFEMPGTGIHNFAARAASIASSKRLQV